MFNRNKEFFSPEELTSSKEYLKIRLKERQKILFEIKERLINSFDNKPIEIALGNFKLETIDFAEKTLIAKGWKVKRGIMEHFLIVGI